MFLRNSFVVSDILVPSERPFIRGVLDCQNFRKSEKCPREKLVNVSDSIQYAMNVIEKNAFIDADIKSGSTRCSPVVYPRLARGGKSTFLELLFDELKASGKYAPILISFNGGFLPRPGESAANAIIRSITSQFIDVRDKDSARVVCDDDALLTHIEATRGDKAVVLLIDELNRLGAPLDPSASWLLKANFLDPLNRALVFTSHKTIDLDFFSKGTSDRTHEVVPLPVSKDLQLLRSMSEKCASLNSVEAAMFGYIPSLIYSMKADKPSLEIRYRKESIIIPQGDGERSVLGEFVRQLLVGNVKYDYEDEEPWIKTVRKFDVFGSVIKVGYIQFPLAFIAIILDEFKFTGEIISNLYKVLKVYSLSTESGKDWEIIVQFAVLLRCVDLCINGNFVNELEVFQGSLSNCSPQLRYVTILGDIKTLGKAHLWISKMLSEYKVPTVVLVSPANSSFHSFDMFVAATSGQPGNKVTIVGIQCKKGMAVQLSPVPSWVDKAYVFSGNANDSSKTVQGWKYLSQSEVIKFLGYSLETLYPSFW